MSASVKKKKNLSIAEKVVILRRIEAGAKNVDIAREFGLVHSAISYMLRNKEQIYKHHRILLENQGDESVTKLSGVEESPIEKSVYQWYKEQKKMGKEISGTMLRDKALEFCEILGGPSTFRASDGWLTRFKKRHGIHRTKKNKLSNEEDEGQMSPDQFSNHLKHHMYNLENVYNLSETAVVWKSLPFNNLDSANDINNRLTMLVCTNATGSHRIPLMIIGDEKNPSCFNNVARMPIIYQYRKNALFDRSLFFEWFKTVFTPSVRARVNIHNGKYLLLLQNTIDSCYPSSEEITAIDPKFSTFFLSLNPWEANQPTDQGIIQKLKIDYRRNFLLDIMMQETETLEQLNTFVKQWTILDFARVLSVAWESVPDLCIVNAWKKVLTGISYFDNDNECLTDIAIILQKLPGCDTIAIEDIISWMNRDSVLPIWNQYRDDSVHEENFSTDSKEDDSIIKMEHEDEDVEEESYIPTTQEAFAAMKTLYEWCETHWEYKQEDLYHLRQLHRVTLDIVMKELHEDMSD